MSVFRRIAFFLVFIASLSCLCSAAPLPVCSVDFVSYIPLSPPPTIFDLHPSGRDILSVGFGSGRVAVIVDGGLFVFNSFTESWIECPFPFIIPSFDASTSQFIALCDIDISGNTVGPCSHLVYVGTSGYLVIQVNSNNGVIVCGDLSVGTIDNSITISFPASSFTYVGGGLIAYYQPSLVTYLKVVGFSLFLDSAQSAPNTENAFIYYQFNGGTDSTTAISGKPPITFSSRLDISLPMESPRFTAHNFVSLS